MTNGAEIRPRSVNGADGWRTDPMYTYAEAAHFAGVSSTTVRRWMYGYEGQSGSMRPVFGHRDRSHDTRPAVSFLQLAEIVIVSRFRSRQVKLERLRKAHEFARDVLKLEYPFASHRLSTDGMHVLHRFEESEPGASLVVWDMYGQMTLPGGVVEALETFEFDKGTGQLAERWYPLGKENHIVIDPRYGAGRPTIEHRRLTIETIRRRWLDGQDIDFIAEDFDLERPLVENALRYSEKLAA